MGESESGPQIICCRQCHKNRLTIPQRCSGNHHTANVISFQEGEEKRTSDQSVSKSENIKLEIMDWEMEAKSLQLNVGICKGLPLGGEVLFSNITKCQRAPLLNAFQRERQKGLCFEIFSLDKSDLLSCCWHLSSALGPYNQLTLQRWKLLAQPGSTIPGYFGTRGKGRRLNLGPILSQQRTDIPVHSLQPPQPAQLLPQTQSLHLIASVWFLNDSIRLIPRWLLRGDEGAR